ncbi:MAG: hypothetical protein Q4G09_00615 [Clostridia bacterium]|nr:hypothetical protein [Clostridia bacterium]
MSVIVNLYSKKNNEISRFLKSYNEKEIIDTNNLLEWKKEFQNPIEIADFIGVFIDNNQNYDINMWICLDSDFFINITDYNANKIIRYLFERYPY